MGQEVIMTKIQAIKAFFNTEGYPHPVTNQELLRLKRDDVTNGTDYYGQIASLCAEALGVALKD